MTLRFQNYNNALENDTHNIEIFYSVFENQNSCPILIERYIDLFVGNSFILSCYSSKPLQFLTSRTPSALGFNGNCIKGEFLMVKNCTSANMGVVVSFTNQTQDYDHISFDQCETKTGGCMIAVCQT
ncbi:hypothetical protein TVAG_252480 [Trichomonas vaginalis G3]|uniref:Uncharacterized protein n=1 Tax=Trichomonas vaginalis (strain ATCC PRA-98 / G3) TaxID=412133 RepID=A2DVZ0_TRIV3|nr:hypothetical protein TVAGG3_0845870 [Trichomonas vaginalis G3]EAY15435.1 hypothetical protein TVAG_252480 [Trichomonas vaginalis G3]KAI5499602.1 hypothetical protein TVAGG3_0845870 [Trichomonas vaginalis G3]|eukprot:XP_001327658.1 hypothetical protein [Trichomonas vaginalis G3]